MLHWKRIMLAAAILSPESPLLSVETRREEPSPQKTPTNSSSKTEKEKETQTET